MADEQSKGGAPRNNGNALRHGVRSLSLNGRVPLKIKGGHHLRSQIRLMRRLLVDEIATINGREPTKYEHFVIHSATRHEARCRLLEKWLAETVETLSMPDRVTVLREIGSSTDSRDKCLRVLGMDRVPADDDPFAAIYRASAIPPATPAPKHQDVVGPSIARVDGSEADSVALAEPSGTGEQLAEN